MFEEQKHVLIVPCNLALETLRELRSRFSLKRIKKRHYEIVAPSDAKLQVWRDIKGSKAQSLEEIIIKEIYIISQQAERVFYIKDRSKLDEYFAKQRQAHLDSLFQETFYHQTHDVFRYMHYGLDYKSHSPFIYPPNDY